MESGQRQATLKRKQPSRAALPALPEDVESTFAADDGAEAPVKPTPQRRGRQQESGGGRASSSPAPSVAQSDGPPSRTAQSTPGEDPVPEDNGVPQTAADAKKEVPAPWAAVDEAGIAFKNQVLDACLVQDVPLFVKTSKQSQGNAKLWQAVAEQVRSTSRSPTGGYYSVDWQQLRVRVWLGAAPKGSRGAITSIMSLATQRDATYNSGTGEMENELWRKARKLNENKKEAKRREDEAASHSASQQRKSAHADKAAAAAMHGRSGRPPPYEPAEDASTPGAAGASGAQHAGTGGYTGGSSSGATSGEPNARPAPKKRARTGTVASRCGVERPALRS